MILEVKTIACPRLFNPNLSRLAIDGFVLLNSDNRQSTTYIAGKIGRIYKVDSMPLVQTLTPRRIETEPANTYSGNFGLNKFPFHTDLAHWHIPPRYLLLRCIVPAIEVATLLLNASTIISEEIEPDLGKALFRPRRKLNGKSYLMQLNQGEIIRWDSVFIRPANKAAELVKQNIESKIHVTIPLEVALDKPGTSLLIDNWKMLHARSSVPEDAISRHIERVYLSEVFL